MQRPSSTLLVCSPLTWMGALWAGLPGVYQLGTTLEALLVREMVCKSIKALRIRQQQ